MSVCEGCGAKNGGPLHVCVDGAVSYGNGFDAGAADFKANVVAWLREVALGEVRFFGRSLLSVKIDDLASDIESGAVEKWLEAKR